MGIFDALLGGGAGAQGPVSGGAGALVPTLPNVPAEGGGGIDPNLLQLLAGIGGNISQGKNLGESIAGPGQQFGTNRALQQTIAKRSQQQAQLMQGIVDALSGGSPTGISDVVGPKTDLNTADSVTITDDGISVKTPKKPDVAPQGGGRLTDAPLESFAGTSNVAAGAGGQLLPF